MKSILSSVDFIVNLLTSRQKARALLVSLLLLLNSGLELIGLGAILPVFAVLLEDDITQKYAWASALSDFFGLQNDTQLISFLAITLFVIILSKNLLGLLIAYLQNKFSMSLYEDLSIRLHEHYYNKGFTFFKSNSSHKVVRNIRFATERFAKNVVLGLLNLFNEILVLSAILVGISIYDPNVLLLLGVTVLPPFLLFYFWVRRKSLLLGNRRRKLEPMYARNLYQSIFGYVDVIVSGSQREFRKRIKGNVSQMADINVKENIYNLAPTRIIETSLMGAICIMILYGIVYLPSKVALLELLGLFAVAGYRIMPSINRMMIAVNGVNQSQWVFPILSQLNTEVKREEKQEELEFHHKLQLEGVSFAYPDSPFKILDHYNLEIRKGETVGIVGPSGSGKTTVMNILLGFLQPSEGHYLIDGQELQSSQMDAFYRKVGYVEQQVYILDASLAENVAFGIAPEAIDHAKLESVLRQACLWDLVEDAPLGVNTPIGEAGAKLSGGQRQRVGIARALYFDAEILFFDEATSSLDSITEKEITESVNRLSGEGLTILIIAHRLSTLEGCDRIVEIAPLSVN